MINPLIASAIEFKKAGGRRRFRGHQASDPQPLSRWFVRWICLAMSLAVVVLCMRTFGSPLPPTTAIGIALLGCLIGWFVGASRLHEKNPFHERRPEELSDVRRTVDPLEADRVNSVKAALEHLREQPVRRANVLIGRPNVRTGEGGAHDVRSLLSDVVGELAGSPRPRDAEAGRLLLDYYIKRVGSHEVIMERLCLSRPTFYRRLKHGLGLVTQRLDEMADPRLPTILFTHVSRPALENGLDELASRRSRAQGRASTQVLLGDPTSA